ncbi:MAG: sialidase family protein [Terriglobales bacterium]
MAYQQEQVPNVATSAGPAWVVNGSKTLLAWKGEGTDPGIYWSTTSALKPDAHSNQYEWAPQQKVPNVGTSAGPALANLKGVVYMAWKGESDGAIYLSKLDSNGAWTPQQKVPGVGGTSDGPALAVTQGTLYLAWKAESGDTRIFWSKSTDGTSWSPQAQVPGVGTSAGPALASDGVGAMYLAWKGESDSFIWWSKCSDGRSWAPQLRGPAGAIAGPALAVDGNKGKWLAWSGNYNFIPLVPMSFGVPVACFSTLVNEAGNVWSSGVGRLGFGTSIQPALLSTGADGSGVMLACSGPSQNNISNIFYGPLLLPAESVEFGMNDLIVNTMRSGHATFKDGTDTVYASISVKIKGQPVASKTTFVGNIKDGEHTVGIAVGGLTIQDTDTVYFSYSAINSSQGVSAATAFLEKAGSQLLNAVEKADEAAIKDLTGLDLSQLSPQEAGALIGAQLGNFVLPGFGAVIGAIAGWFADTLAGFFSPLCDGPVAAGVYVFSAPQLRGMLTSGGFTQTDDNPGTTSAGGCGSNSDYQVIWTAVPLINLSANSKAA